MKRFIAWYNNEFKQTPLYSMMEQNVENSPWHRERNTGIHTDMVVSQLLASLGKYATMASELKYCALFAAAFHDVGKPVVRREKFSEARGNYVAFGGHELMSARLWETWAISSRQMLLDEFGLTKWHIYMVGTMIEQHLLWQMTPAQVGMMAKHFHGNGMFIPFMELCDADNNGRISLEHDENATDRFYQIPAGKTMQDVFSDPAPDTKYMVMLIGASGSGKSTIAASMEQGSNAVVYSWDRIRHQLFNPDGTKSYDEVYADATANDKLFASTQQTMWNDLLHQKPNVILVDNTNISRKRRQHFLRSAQHAGYVTVAYMVLASLHEIIDRQQTRGDKCLAPGIVSAQYNSLQYPLYGEFDGIVVL